GIVLPLFGLLFPAIQKTREAAARIQSSNNLRQVSLGMINRADMNAGDMLPAVVYSQDGKPLYSWRVLILPYIDQANLFHQFNLDEPWDSPNNKALLARMPKTFHDPGRESDPGSGMTYYQVFDGPGAAFDSTLEPGRPPLPFQVLQKGRVQTLYRSHNKIRFP